MPARSDPAPEVRAVPPGAAVVALAFAPQGDLLAAAGRDGAVRIWDPREGQHLRALRDGAAAPYALAFAPDGVRLAASYNDQTIRIWNIEKGAVVRRIAGQLTQSLVFLAEADRLAIDTSAAGAAFLIMSAGTGTALDKVERVYENLLERTFGRPPFPPGNICGITALAAASTGNHLAGSDLCGRVAVYDARTLEFRWAVQRPYSYPAFIPAPRAPRTELSFSADGSLLAGGAGNAVVVWNASSGKERRRFQGHRSAVRAVAFAPGEQPFLASASEESLKLWNPLSRLLYWEIPLEGRLNQPHLAFSPDGETVAVSYGGQIMLVNVHSGEARFLALPRDQLTRP
ncbi:WD40 repeat domain-containing protein [Desertibaculum subflavum]|uniref:WD40 repeat domain-containing protein n=1 Tax=Desertibaculum subflavum TaxID=2268458 RepID=UPI0013C4E52C